METYSAEELNYFANLQKEMEEELFADLRAEEVLSFDEEIRKELLEEIERENAPFVYGSWNVGKSDDEHIPF